MMWWTATLSNLQGSVSYNLIISCSLLCHSWVAACSSAFGKIFLLIKRWSATCREWVNLRSEYLSEKIHHYHAGKSHGQKTTIRLQSMESWSQTWLSNFTCTFGTKHPLIIIYEHLWWCFQHQRSIAAIFPFAITALFETILWSSKQSIIWKNHKEQSFLTVLSHRPLSLSDKVIESPYWKNTKKKIMR